MRALLWCGARNPPGQDRLHTEEQVLRDEWLEVAACSANAVFVDVHDAGIELVPQQHADRLRSERTARRLVKPQALDCLRSCCLVKRPGAEGPRRCAAGFRAWSSGSLGLPPLVRTSGGFGPRRPDAHRDRSRPRTASDVILPERAKGKVGCDGVLEDHGFSPNRPPTL